MHSPLRLCVLSVLLAALSCPAADSSVSANSGRKPDLESARLLLQSRYPAKSEIDTNQDGQISDDELLAWAAKNSPIQTSDSNVPAKPKVPAFATDPAPAKTKPAKWGISKLHLAQDHDSLVKDLDKADPGSLGYYRNHQTHENTWAIQAALGAKFEITDRSQPMFLGYLMEPLTFIPSVTLNRVTGKGDGTLNAVDSLAFRAGVAMALNQPAGAATMWERQTISLAYRNTGTSQGGKFKSAGELEWTPVDGRADSPLPLNSQMFALLRSSDGKRIEPGNPLFYSVIFALRTEGGQSTTEGNFIKSGPKVGLQVQPVFAPNLLIFGTYTYLWEVARGKQDFDYLETGLRWGLDETQQIFLDGKYRHGLLPAKYTPIDVYQLSLSVKF